MFAPSSLHQIEDVLDACAIVPARQVSSDVVTMYTQVLLLDPSSGERTRLALCYPADADPANGFVSVLSPMGFSLFGLPPPQAAFISCVGRSSIEGGCP
jgi:regulator of nucleoside diphosphate kinase